MGQQENPDPLALGDSLLAGKYKVLGVLGQGGMGVVYVTEHVRLKQKRAVKFMLPEIAANKTAMDRFFNEAIVGANLKIPGLVEVYDLEEWNGMPFIAMEFLEGRSLGSYLDEKGKIDPWEALDIIAEATIPLQALHDRGIYHRDIKPDNIFLCSSGPVRVKVMDLGIAHVRLPDNKLTKTGSMMGTPLCMAREMIRGEPIDGRTDLYALGVVLYRATSGSWPFMAEGYELFGKILETEPIDIAKLVQGLDSEIAAIIRKAGAAERDQRFSSVAELRSVIDQVRSRKPRRALAAPTDRTVADMPGPLPVARPSRARRIGFALLAIAVAVAAVATVLYLSRGRQPPPVEASAHVAPPPPVAAQPAKPPPASAPTANPAPAPTTAPVDEAPTGHRRTARHRTTPAPASTTPVAAPAAPSSNPPPSSPPAPAAKDEQKSLDSTANPFKKRTP